MHWTDHWHKHVCPQCHETWTCGASGCRLGWKRFCPHGELCHVDSHGIWKVVPQSIRKGSGVGILFDPRGITVVSRYQKGDQSKVAAVKEKEKEKEEKL